MKRYPAHLEVIPDEWPEQANCPTDGARAPLLGLQNVSKDGNIHTMDCSEPIRVTPVSNSEFGTTVAPFDTLFDDSEHAFQEILRYFESLEKSNPTLFGIISDTAQELSLVAGAQCMGYRLGLANEGTTETLTRPFITQGLEVFFNGRLMHKCKECGKLHDRKSRLIACMNSHSGRKPYHCGGSCGRKTCKKIYASEELLNRHCVPSSDRLRECSRCNAKVLKQNLSRHKKSCSLTSQT